VTYRSGNIRELNREDAVRLEELRASHSAVSLPGIFSRLALAKYVHEAPSTTRQQGDRYGRLLLLGGPWLVVRVSPASSSKGAAGWRARPQPALD
jgi:hypothetical protein